MIDRGYQPTASRGPWRTWPKGEVTVDTLDRLDGQVYALRFTATDAGGIAEISQ